MNLRDTYNYPGIPVTADLTHIDSIHTIWKGDRSLTLFTCRLNKLRLRLNSYWQTVRDQLPDQTSAYIPCDGNAEFNIGNSAYEPTSD